MHRASCSARDVASALNYLLHYSSLLRELTPEERATVQRVAVLLEGAPDLHLPTSAATLGAVRRLESTLDRARTSLEGLARTANTMAGESPAAINPALMQKLTRREWEVLHLLIQGLSTKEVARSLGVTFKTAAAHRSHIMAKLNVHNVASLVRVALEAAPRNPAANAGS